MTDARFDRPPPSGALSELPQQVAALQSAVRALIAHLLREHRDHPDVEDGTSEVARRALEGRDRLRPGEPLRPWVLGIARHVALDALRQRGKALARRAEQGRGPESSRTEIFERLATDEPSPELTAAQLQRARRMRQAMAQLVPQQREALELFHLEGLGYREIAERLAVPLGTVGTWVMRGRQNLAAALGKDEQPS